MQPGPPQSAAPRRRGVPTAAVVAVGFVLVVAAIVVGIFWRSASNTTSADGVAGRYASALQDHSTETLKDLSCADVSGRAVDLAQEVDTASVQHVSVTGTTAAAQLEITAELTSSVPAPSNSPNASPPKVRTTFPATVRMQQDGKSWCVNDFQPTLPAF